MTETHCTSRRHVVIVDPLGLHLRAVTRLVGLAQSFRSDITVICRGIRANGKSTLDLMSLAAECGEVIDLEAVGSDAGEAVAALADQLATAIDLTPDGGGVGGRSARR
jgi:phosphotransferase system HPr (HPr) family protein